MLVTNKFPIDINVLGDYFWATKIMQIFSLSGNYPQKYFIFHLVHCYISHQLIYMLCWKNVNIFQENSHKNQINLDIFYLYQIAVTPHQHLTKCVGTHLYCEGNDMDYFLNGRQYITQNISSIIFHNLKQNGWLYWFCQQELFYAHVQTVVSSH